LATGPVAVAGAPALAGSAAAASFFLQATGAITAAAKATTNKREEIARLIIRSALAPASPCANKQSTPFGQLTSIFCDRIDLAMVFAIHLIYVDPLAARGDVDAEMMLLPRRASAGAAGLDLASAVDVTIAPGARALVPTGVAVALPAGTEGQIRPRSGLALHHGVTCLNSPGTIDSDYRGELKVLLVNFGDASFVVERGMRIAQLVVARVESPQIEVVSLLPDPTARGTQGFGSTGVR
jgi:dUTP pyrophosphatase